jgi:flavin-binding protein dodecin
MMDEVMARKLWSAAEGAISLAGDVVRHVAWFVAHQVDGRPRRRD